MPACLEPQPGTVEEVTYRGSPGPTRGQRSFGHHTLSLPLSSKVHPYAAAGHEVGTGGPGALEQQAAGVRLERVVAVEEHDVVAPRVRHADVARPAATAGVHLERDHADAAGMLRRDTPGHAGRSVGARVVHDDQLDVRHRLPQHRAHRGRQAVGVVVVDDDNDRDLGHVPRLGRAGQRIGSPA